MTAPMLLPLRADAETEPVSRCIAHYRARDLSTSLVSGQVGVFTRGATGGLTDQNGATFTATGYTQPNFEPLVWTSSTWAMMLRLSTAEHLYWLAKWRPRALGFYHEFVQAGSMAAAFVTLWSVINNAGTGAWLILDSTGSAYRLNHSNGTTTVSATLTTAPSAGQRVVHWGYLYDDGSVQLWQSINEGVATFTARTAACTRAAAWGTNAHTNLCGFGTTAGVPAWHRVFKLVAASPTLAQLQTAF